MRTKLLPAFPIALIGALLFVATPAARAGSTYTVSSLLDNGKSGELRAAIVNANTHSGSTINFSVTGTITLTSALPQITAASMTITGPGASSLAIDGGGSYQPFSVASGATLMMDDVTIQNSYSSDLGGGLLNDGTTKLTNCTFSGNSSVTAGGAVYNNHTITFTTCTLSGNNSGGGGAVFNDDAGAASSLTLTSCTLSSNTAGVGGAVYNTDLHGPVSTAKIIGCTLSGNSSGSDGGAIWNSASTSLTNCTLTANSASKGYTGDAVYSSNTLALSSCTLAANGNSSTGAEAIFTTGTSNIFTNCILYDNDADGEIYGGGSVNATYCDIEGGYSGTGNFNVNPLLGPLGNYGGSTETMSLLPGSPCFGGGISINGVTADQRGVGYGYYYYYYYGYYDNGYTGNASYYPIGAFAGQGFYISGGNTGATLSTPLNSDFPNITGIVTPYDGVDAVAGGVLYVVDPESGATASLTGTPMTLGADGSFSVAATANDTVGAYYISADPDDGPFSQYVYDNYGAVWGYYYMVNQSPTTTVVTSASNPLAYPNKVIFRAKVTASTPWSQPNGTVQFAIDGVNAGSPVTVSMYGNTGTIAIADTPSTALSVGTHSITATYSGDTYNSPSTAGALSQVVTPTVSTTTIGTSLNPSTYGQSVTFTANVTGTSPTGTVQFAIDGSNSGSPVTLVSGSAAYMIANIGAGAHGVTATYSGDTDNTSSTSATAVSQVVNQATTTTLSDGPYFSYYGQSVTLNASVSSAGGQPTGTVQFAVDGNVIGSGPVTVLTGVASYTTSSLSTGTHSLVVTYGGDANHIGSTSQTDQIIVAPDASTTTLASSLNPSTDIQSPIFTATVTGSSSPTGTVQFAIDGTNAGSPVTLASGSAAYTAAGLSVGTHNITATYSGDTNDTSSSTSGPLLQVVTASAATSFTVGAPSTAVAGSTINVTVTAYDAVGNVAAGYVGTVQLSTTDTSPFTVLPASSTLTNGVGLFPVTLDRAGSQTVTATDTVNTALTATSNAITVTPASFTHLVAGAPSPQIAGTGVTVTFKGLDQYGNIATSYSGTEQITTTDSAAAHVATATVSSGIGTTRVTFKTAGSQTVTATDVSNSSITATTNAVVVSASSTTHLGVSTPSTATAGSSITATVTALDAYNNTVIGYAGTVAITSTDASAGLPASATLSNGVGTFPVTLKTAGSRRVIATDTGTPSITGTSPAIVVSGATASYFMVSAPSTAKAGSGINVTVTAKDAYGNTATGYGGTVHLSSTDAKAALPANSALTSGTGTFRVTLKTLGSQTVSATDTATSTVTGTSGTIAVN